MVSVDSSNMRRLGNGLHETTVVNGAHINSAIRAHGKLAGIHKTCHHSTHARHVVEDIFHQKLKVSFFFLFVTPTLG